MDNKSAGGDGSGGDGLSDTIESVAGRNGFQLVKTDLDLAEWWDGTTLAPVC